MVKFFKLVFLFIFAFALFACGGETVKKDPPAKETPKEVVKKPDDASFKAPNIDSQLPVYNAQLDKATIDQFESGKSKIPSYKWDKWAEMAAPVIKEILTRVPDGYVIKIVGHTDIVGTEKYNKKLSINRAKTVYLALKKQGITSKKLKYTGVGSLQMLPNTNHKDGAQRRVSFIIVRDE